MNEGSTISDAHRQEAEARGIRSTPTPTPSSTPRRRPTARSTAAAAARAEREALRNTPVPEGVRRSKNGLDVNYDFRVGDNNVNLYFSTYRSGGVDYRTVGFQVNGSYGMDRSRISDEERSEISRKIAASLKHQITQDDNAEYECTAFEDGQEGFRALAYTRMGFSRPVGGIPGNDQVAVIKNGKIDARATQTTIQRIDEIQNPGSSSRADAEWNSQLEEIEEERRQERQARRARTNK